MVHLNNRGPSQRFEPVSRSFVPKSVPKSCSRWAAQQTVNPTLASFPIWAGRQADLADAVVRGEVTANAAARQKGWRPPRIELRDPTVVAARIREHFSREQIDLLIALFSERKPMTSPGNPFTVDRSSSPHEGAADGQQRQDPTDRPAHAWRTPCHADSGRRCRWCHCCRLDGMGNDRPLVDLRPIG